jgi:hypothetical protein
MAEIIAKMAVSYMPTDGQPTAGAVATRDQRLLLSAAIRMHIPEEDIADWTAERMEETARNVRIDRIKMI